MGDLASSQPAEALLLLVTGASGNVGRALLPELLPRLAAAGHGDVVFGVRNRADARRRFAGTPLADVHSISMDLAGPRPLAAIDGMSIRGVLHLAAETRSGQLARNLRVNRDGTAALVGLARERGHLPFIHFSTPLAQSRRPSPYGVSKQAAEHVVQDSGLPYAILRPQFLMSPLRPGMDGGFARLVSLAQLPVLPFPDPDLVLAPLYVGDLADAVLGWLSHGPAGDVCAMRGDPVTFRTFYRAVRRLLGRGPRLLSMGISAARMQRWEAFARCATRRDPSWGLLGGHDASNTADGGLLRGPTPFNIALERCLLAA